MTTTSPQAQAARLRELHRPGQPLVLPNAWDAASARIVEEAGFPAVATASAAIAAMLGHPDHEGAPAEEMLAAAATVARAVQVPVTVDAEAGYGLPAADLVDKLLGMGAVGCNLEDTNHSTGELVDVDEQAERIATVRAAATDAGVELVINARADTFVHGETPEAVAGAIERGRCYLAAGADCVYPILAVSEEAITQLVAGIPGPVNVGCFPGAPTPRRLAELGVARISFGPVPYRAALAAFRSTVDRIAAGESPVVP
jgi:2-methylisocitrate lyase-like PEP mutase family enzyme